MDARPVFIVARLVLGLYGALMDPVVFLWMLEQFLLGCC